MDPLDFRSFAIPEQVTDELRGWFNAVGLGFGSPQASDESLKRWRDEVARDGWRLDAAYATDQPSWALASEQPVATFATTTQTINNGNGHLEPVCFITDVTVRTTHRRRGLLKRLMTDALARARDEGLSMAALTVTEGGIYGRFGFGVATHYRSAELDTGPRFAVDVAPDRSVVQVSPDESVRLRRQVFDGFHANTRGSHQRLAYYDAYLSGQWDYDKGAANPAMRAAVHVDAAGEPDGVVAYELDTDNGILKVRDLLALSGSAELGLWQFLAAIDLIDKAEIRRLSPTSPLPWALTDPRRLKVTGVGDFTWLRVLDVEKAFGVRHVESDGDVAFTVTDPLGHASGAWRLVGRDGVLEVNPASSEPSLQVDVRALGSLYFGLVDARTLVAAGQISGPEADVRAFEQLLATAEPPHNAAGF